MKNRSPLSVLAPLTLLVPLLAACSDPTPDAAASAGRGGSGGEPSAGGAGGEGGDPFALVLSWEPCPLDSAKSEGDDAECARVAVPAEWAAPGGDTLELFVKRWPVSEDADTDLWLVPGGPGYSGVEWEARVASIAGTLPGTRFYMADHRGTGRSSRLSCPEQEDAASDAGIEVTLAEWPACIDELEKVWADRLASFTTSNAARDLGELIEATRGERRALVMGQSYGTALVQRYLHYFPAQADAVLLDSLANPGFTFTAYSERVDVVGKQFLALCGQDANCAARVGDDPPAILDAAFAGAFDLDACPGMADTGLDRARLAGVLFVALLFPEYRPIVPAVTHRLARCNADDVAAFTHLGNVLDAPAAPSLAERMFSPALHHHVILSELWDDDPPTPEDHQAVLDDLEFGVLDVELDTLLPTWPRYADDPLTAAFPKTAPPVAMFNGTLDAPTPLEYALAAETAYHGPGQHFVVVPGAPHGAIGGEPWSKPDLPCSIRVAIAFIEDPTAPPDTSCFAEADAPSFEASAATSLTFFGTTDAWGDPSADAGLTAPAVVAEAALEKERLRARYRAALRR